jgi:single-strand DNA-binding protein
MSTFTINRVVLIGRLTRDPELRQLASGSSVCTLRIACNSTRRDAEGEYQDKPNFFDVSVFGVAAENVSRYISKGSRIAIDGRLEWREWETADQQKRQAVSVVADTVLFLDGPGQQSQSGRPQGGESSDPFGGEQGGESSDPFGGQEDSELVGVGAGAPEDNDLIF